MLSRLNRETRQDHQLADDDRLAILDSTDRAGYATFLTRVHGFEAPLEAALLRTNELDQWLDLRDRGHIKLLRADLASLGITDASQLPRCRAICPFDHPAEALGWVYVVERNALLHGVIDRHLRSCVPELLKTSGSYLAGQARSNGRRMRDLGAAMDRVARDPASAERIVAGAKAAFCMQHEWYEVAALPQRNVA
jgi:heme oxygenase